MATNLPSPFRQTVKAFELTGFGLERLRLVDRAIEPLGPGDVRVLWHAASLNYRDRMVVTGAYGLPEDSLPFIPVSDGAGVVVEVGARVKRLKVGDRVTNLMTRGWIAGPLTPERHALQNGGPLDGVLTESSVLDEAALAIFPDHLSFEEAACFPVAALTAWSALSEAGLQPGQTVLATGSGNVSLFTLQLARLWGAKVIVSSGDPGERADRLRELGAHAVVDYRDPDWPAQVVAANGGAGVDMVVENGGARTLGASIEALRQGGFLAMVGVLALTGEPAPDATLPLLLKNVRLRGMVTGSRDSYEAMHRAVALHRLRPVIDSVHPFADVRQAFSRAFDQRPFGKVVIRVGDGNDQPVRGTGA